MYGSGGNEMRILLVEDDRTIAAGLEYSLSQEGYETVACHTYEAAKEMIERDLGLLDLCLLDISLPDGSGYDLCRLVKEKRDVPVIFLTAMDEEINVVMGLDMGADDYIAKPFRVRELLSRIQSVLRRYAKQLQSKAIVIQDVQVHPQQGMVYKQGEEVALTAMEYRLLLTFANHLGQVLTRQQLLEQIWDAAGDFVNDNTLTVYIKRLREKLENDPQRPEIIKTVRGLGYRAGA